MNKYDIENVKLLEIGYLCFHVNYVVLNNFILLLWIYNLGVLYTVATLSGMSL